jgi:hypothetical protein
MGCARRLVVTPAGIGIVIQPCRWERTPQHQQDPHRDQQYAFDDQADGNEHLPPPPKHLLVSQVCDLTRTSEASRQAS